MIDKKILVIGNETRDTDDAVTILARNSDSINHGLVSDSEFVPAHNGYYHTTVVDIFPGDIVNLAKHFDTVMMLDQDPKSYPHFKSLVTTVRLMCDLDSSGVTTIYKDNISAKNLIYWRKFLSENKSFCFYPFAALINDNEFAHICEKNHSPIAKIHNSQEWKNNPGFIDIRNKMVSGTLIPKYCSDCYDREEDGQESMRQFETLEWASRLNATSVNDFIDIEKPVYYEIRPSNKCNIMCRTCDATHSHLIEKEWKKIGFPTGNVKYQNTPFEQIDFESVQSIYVGGGEPTVLSEFYDFLQKCISIGKTDFDLNIGTNGLKVSDKLVKLLDHFNNVCLSVSFDGYKKVNDYIRWESDFDTIVSNSLMMQEHGHKIGLQTVFSMYNLTRIHEIFEFYDREFPGCSSLVNYATDNQFSKFEPDNHPCPELVIESMKRCQQTKVYYSNGRSIKSMVDLTLKHYSDPDYKVDIDRLKKFYDYNTLLDQSRGSNLAHYIPELEEGCRFYLPI